MDFYYEFECNMSAGNTSEEGQHAVITMKDPGNAKGLLFGVQAIRYEPTGQNGTA